MSQSQTFAASNGHITPIQAALLQPSYPEPSKGYPQPSILHQAQQQAQWPQQPATPVNPQPAGMQPAFGTQHSMQARTEVATAAIVA